MIFMAKDKKFSFNRVLIMGILNATPDSFSDGGLYIEVEKAAAHGLQMINDGADIIDIGGESTSPGAAVVSADVEMQRVIPVIKAIRSQNKNICISVDTSKSQTAIAALKAGADIVNDISGGTFDKDIMKECAKQDAGFVIMHIQGSPKTMQIAPVYSSAGVVSDIKDFFKTRIAEALNAGLKRENLIIDPGIGFGKTLKDNFEILDKLEELKELGYPILIGTSRKSLIGNVLKLEPAYRTFGTAATVAIAVAKGADIVRVHEVKEMKQTATMARAMIDYNKNSEKGNL